jgi:hypothetical protein
MPELYYVVHASQSAARPKLGDIVRGPENAHLLAAQGMVSMPVDEDCLDRAAGGANLTFYGDGRPFSSTTPRREPGACVFVRRGVGYLYWVALMRGPEGGQLELHMTPAMRTTGVVCAQEGGSRHATTPTPRWVGHRCRVEATTDGLIEMDLFGRASAGTVIEQMAVSYSTRAERWKYDEA